MGAVHCVRDRNLLREVAYKELTPSLAGDLKYVRKFKSEAQIQAQLDHPNIVPVHDFFSQRPVFMSGLRCKKSRALR
jgi:serine/threonine protein kinase